ncbi:MAG: GspH/FimT family pseudopilin [Burkholderiaceae bacterium]|nr:GspH/FimT family pseudopilin [Burkholderiaceae bacterium]
MVGLTIGALLLMMGVPFFGDYVRNARLRESGNALLSEALYAQSEAIKRNSPVRLSSDGATLQVIDRSDVNNEVVLRERTLATDVAAEVATVDFGSEGRPMPFGASGSINLSMAGVACSDDTRCPGLRIDAGGATRLCGNRLNGCD